MFYFFIPNRHRTSCRVDKIYQERGVVSSCSAQTRSGISLLGNFLRQKPLGVRASYAAHAQTQVKSEQVWLNTTFISRGLRLWDKLAVETLRIKTKLIIITILHIIITTTSILNLRLKQLRQKYWRILKCTNKY
jgi:hypothetical protein